MNLHTDRTLLNVGWLTRLRWIAVAGQLMTVTFVLFGLRIELPLPIVLFSVIALTAISNMMLLYWLKGASASPELTQHSDVVPGFVMIMDMLNLTALLYGSSGPANPFSIFFLVNVSLSSIVLRRNWAWGLSLLAIISYAFLLFSHVPIAELDLGRELLPIRDTGSITLLQAGMFLSFVLSCIVITYFITRITDELRNQEVGLRSIQQQQARSEKLEALGTLAAGTAHELATPLSTIAVVARDVEKFFEAHPPDHPEAAEVVEDIHLIRSQLDRCRSILNRMAGTAGQAVGETMQSVSVADLWDLVLEDLSPEVEERNLVEIDIPGELADETLDVPAIVLSQALRGLVQNALDSSNSTKKVTITVRGYARHWHWMISDEGSGIPPEIMSRLSEPFFSTKPVGKGMGLGMFLARNVIERLDGSLDIASTQNQGTEVAVRLPRREKSGKSS